MNTISPETRNEVELLKNALKHARDKIQEQSAKLNELTAPPFMYATVVALSGWRDDKTSSQTSYTDTMGEKITVDTKTKTLLGFHLGDALRFVDEEENSKVLALIKDAEKLVIVGFIDNKMVVVQIDDGVVVVDSPEVISNIFRVVRTGHIGMIDTAVIVNESIYYEVLLPKGITVNPGDTVTVVKETMQIVDVASVQIGGDIGYVNQVINKHFAEIEYQSATRVVFTGRYADSLEKGDRIVLDQTASVIVHNLGKEDERFRFTADAEFTWDDIAGLEGAKAQMIEAVELPYKNPDLVAHYHKKPVKGILLYGPPGCGKTMLGKATATAIARINIKDTKQNGFIYIKGPEILERYVGIVEAVIRQIFERARKHKKDFGFPAVIFIDEAESLLSKRGSGISSDIEKTIVPMFCTEMDGLEDSGALVILATNRPDILDPAITRDRRVDRKIKIDRPTVESAKGIFLLNLKGVPLDNGDSYEDLARLGSSEMFKPDRVLYELQVKGRGTVKFTLRDIINGGMVAGVVEKAISMAINRDISNQKRGGLRKEDIILAVDMVEQQNRDLNHTEELSEFTHDFREDIVSVQKLCQSVG